MSADPISLEIFKHLFASIAEEMGLRLMRSAYSPNIRERRDFSCALFDIQGEMIAQAAHIPVHLGSTPMSVQAVLSAFPPSEMKPGDIFVLNDPYSGGTHLPDITLVAPCFLDKERKPRFFVADRAHHADVGGKTPGSMPLSRTIYEEGIRILPRHLDDETQAWIATQSRTPQERYGDLFAQKAALQIGIQRLQAACQRYGADTVSAYAAALQSYTERYIRSILQGIPDGIFSFQDVLDSDGFGRENLSLHCSIRIRGDQATVDFSHTCDQTEGPVNAVRAIAISAVNYAFRCLAPSDLPSNGGVMRPIQVITRPGSLLDALPPAAVAAGNVETSQRIVDLLFGALALALPKGLPAASCGSMGNLTIGGFDPIRARPFAYYETIAGGSGASSEGSGQAAIHTHMTNTRNTPIEALEHAYPFRIERYAIRRGSGGSGLFSGGDGLIRSYAFSSPATVTLLAERHLNPPWGVRGGSPGSCGRHRLRKPDGSESLLPSKAEIEIAPSSVLTIETPGGGGWGVEPQSRRDIDPHDP